MAAVGLTPSGTVVAEDIRDLQHRMRQGPGYFAGGLPFSLRLRFGEPSSRTFGKDSSPSGLSTLAIMPVATRV